MCLSSTKHSSRQGVECCNVVTAFTSRSSAMQVFSARSSTLIESSPMQGWTTSIDQLMSFVDEVLRMPDDKFTSQDDVRHAQISTCHGTNSLALPCCMHVRPMLQQEWRFSEWRTEACMSLLFISFVSRIAHPRYLDVIVALVL